jgi:hypothetical protein
MELRNCRSCGDNFAVYETVERANQEVTEQLDCPRCASLRHERRVGVVEARKCLEEYHGVKIISDLPSWVPVHTRAGDALKSVTKGSKGGASWSGRIDIWARGFGEKPPAYGDLVDVRVMESTIAPKKGVVQKRIDNLFGVITKQATEEARVQRDKIYEEEKRSVEIEDILPGIRQDVIARFREELSVVETHKYIVLTPTDPAKLLEEERNANRMLVFQPAYSKTTLKGLGRQFHASLDTENVISVLGSASGSARSGRFGTHYVLAVVSPDHPLIRKFSEDGHTEATFYPAKAEVCSELDKLLEAEVL